MGVPAIARVASMFSVAASRLTLPYTVVIASGTRPLAISSSRAWASSTPPSVSKIRRLRAIAASTDGRRVLQAALGPQSVAAALDLERAAHAEMAVEALAVVPDL